MLRASIQQEPPAATNATTAHGADAVDAVVWLDHVTKLYTMGSDTVRALDGVSVQFRRGEFWAILGTSGSGKSTLLNILGCLDRPTTGHYALNGQRVANLSDDQLSDLRLRELGFIFQSFNLISEIDVQENIELPLYYQGWPPERSAERARQLADHVGLGNRLRHRPAELSGGQRQRVAIARALANDPAVLLADEPTGNLDSATSKQIMDLISSLHRQGKTIVLVTHEPDIAAYAQRRLVMRDGRIDRIE